MDGPEVESLRSPTSSFDADRHGGDRRPVDWVEYPSLLERIKSPQRLAVSISYAFGFYCRADDTVAQFWGGGSLWHFALNVIVAAVVLKGSCIAAEWLL